MDRIASLVTMLKAGTTSLEEVEAAITTLSNDMASLATTLSSWSQLNRTVVQFVNNLDQPISTTTILREAFEAYSASVATMVSVCSETMQLFLKELPVISEDS